MQNRIACILLALALVLSIGPIGCGGDGVPEIAEYNLSISSTEGGSVATPGEGPFTYGEVVVVNLVAEAEDGYRFVEWTGDVDTIDDTDAASTAITMNDDYSITAHFVAQYVLTIDSIHGGEVTDPGEGSFTYDRGTEVVLVATSEAGYVFVGWMGHAEAVYDANKRVTTITMNGGYSITAHFDRKIDYAYSGSVRSHAASDPHGYTWFSFVPDDLRQSPTYYILLTAEGGNTDYGATIENVRGLTTFFSWNPSLSNLICIGVAIPRGEGWKGEYAVAMPASVFSDAIDEEFYRPDLKVSAIIEDFTSELESYGAKIHDKVLMWGFSNSAMFAQRYCFLHPGKVKAVAIGQAGGALTMGMDTYSNNELDWPVGTNDFSVLTSVDFDADAYNSIPKFIFIGEEDTGPYQSTVYSPVYGWNLEIFTADQCQILYDIADTDPIRVRNQSVIMNNNGDNITFKMYPGIGHQFCSEMQYDVGVFFSNIIDK